MRGAHVIEDLLLGKPVVLRAVSYGSDCYPRKELVTEITLADLNQAIMSNPRNAYQRYNAAGNSGARVLHTYMGKLLPGCGNVNFSGAGELSPLINDPDYATIGIGTRIFLGGGIGYVTGSGTQHNPGAQFATLMVQGDLKQMSAEFLKAALFHGYGSSMYVGIGIPIPVLNAGIARNTGISDRDIETDVIDYSVPSRTPAGAGPLQLRAVEIGFGAAQRPRRPHRAPGQLPQVQTGGPDPEAVDRAGRIPSERAGGQNFRPGLGQADGPETAAAAAGSFLPAPAAWFRFPATPAYISWNEQLCISCGQCLGICPAQVFRHDAEWQVTAELERCTDCGRATRFAPRGAIVLRKK